MNEKELSAFLAMLEALKKAYSLTAPLSTYGRELARVIEQAEAVRK